MLEAPNHRKQLLPPTGSTTRRRRRSFLGRRERLTVGVGGRRLDAQQQDGVPVGPAVEGGAAAEGGATRETPAPR